MPPQWHQEESGSALSLSLANGCGRQHHPGPDQKHAGFRRDPGGESGPRAGAMRALQPAVGLCEPGSAGRWPRSALSGVVPV